MEQPGRQRSPGHRDWATLRLGMTESYGTTVAAEMPKPPRLGRTYVGNNGTNRGGRDAQATEIVPNRGWDAGKLWNNLCGRDAQATEIGPNLWWE